MPPMLRRLLAVLSVPSLILCVGTVGLWVRSYYVVDHLCYGSRRNHCIGVLLGRGVIQADLISNGWGSGWGYERGKIGDSNFLPIDVDFIQPQGQLGFETGSVSTPVFGLSIGPDTTPRPNLFCRFIVFPHWWLVAVTAVLPLFWLRQRLRGNPSVGGAVCPSCAYDLRATPNRCPECNWRVAEGDAREASHA